MAEKKICKVKNTTWEITPVTYEDMKKAELAGYTVTDYAWQHTKYLGRCLETGERYWLARAYRKNIEEILDSKERNK